MEDDHSFNKIPIHDHHFFFKFKNQWTLERLFRIHKQQ